MTKNYTLEEYLDDECCRCKRLNEENKRLSIHVEALRGEINRFLEASIRLLRDPESRAARVALEKAVEANEDPNYCPVCTDNQAYSMGMLYPGLQVQCPLCLGEKQK